MVTLAVVVLLRFPCAAAGPQDLKGLLDATEHHYQQLRAFTSRFRQVTRSASAATMATEATGRLYYLKPKRMRWEYETPERQVFIVHHSIGWLYVPDDHQVTLLDENRLFASPLVRVLFDGLFQLQKHFSIQLDNQLTTSAHVVLDMVPHEEDPYVKSIKLWVERKTHLITSFQTSDALGNTNRLEFIGQKSVADLPEALFDLEVPGNTTVIDSQGRVLNTVEIHALQKLIRSQK